MSFILGSTSSARIKILTNLGVEFSIRSPLFDERSLPFLKDPVDYTSKLALFKNQSIEKSPHEIVCTCDTIVYLKDRVLNKPTSYEEAFEMLECLSASEHQVITAISLAHKGEMISSCEINQVYFKKLSKDQIEKFLEDPLYLHRAGAYTVTGKGALLIDKINGSYESIVGLPLNTLESLLNSWDISLWDFIY